MKRTIERLVLGILVAEVFLVTVLGLWGQILADLSPVRALGVILIGLASWGLLEHVNW
jgi:hypothetical protein